jgi:hypothetical protein
MDVTAAVIGGLLGGAAMIAVLYPMRALAPQQMKMDFLKLVGTMVVPAGATAYAAGLAIHAMMSVIFGLIHGGLVASTDVSQVGSAAVVGGAFGLGHAVIVGALMGMMPMMHPRMRPEQPKLVPAFEGIAVSAPSEALLEPPGAFALNYPAATRMGFFAMHVMFGAIVAAVYVAYA